MTIDALSSFGVQIKPVEGGWRIRPAASVVRLPRCGGGE